MKFLVLLFSLVVASSAFPGSHISGEFEPAKGFITPNGKPIIIDATRIVGGSEAVAHAYPHQISLQLRTADGWYHMCGGSIIEADKILTAAHCVLNLDSDISTLRVVAGDHDLFVSEGTEQVGQVLATFPHPRHLTGDGRDFDYAVIRLSSPLTLNANVKAIEMTTTEALSGDCISSGWGTTSTINNPERLQQVTIPIVPRAQCEELWGNYYNLTSRMICAGGDGTGPCNGDSGGPLVCDGRLAGLTSWGSVPCGQLKYPGVYANVAPAVNWIGLQ